MSTMKQHYIPAEAKDEAPFSFDFDSAYSATGYRGVAWRVFGYESEPDEDTEWSGYENATGRLVAHMVGDDRTFTFEPDELEPLDEDDYCPSCGQIGCGWH